MQRLEGNLKIYAQLIMLNDLRFNLIKLEKLDKTRKREN